MTDGQTEVHRAIDGNAERLCRTMTHKPEEKEMKTEDNAPDRLVFGELDARDPYNAPEESWAKFQYSELDGTVEIDASMDPKLGLEHIDTLIEWLKNVGRDIRARRDKS